MATMLEFLGSSLLILFFDLFIYGYAVPISASFLAGYMAELFEMEPAQEVLLVVEFTFVIFSLIGYLKLEQDFLSNLLQFDQKTMTLLDVRTFHNGLCIAYDVVALVQSIQNMTKLGGMKERYLSEDVYFVLKRRIQYYLDYWSVPDPTSSIPESASIASAEFMIIISQLFAEISRLLYLTGINGYTELLSIIHDHNVQMERQNRQNQIQNIQNNNNGQPQPGQRPIVGLIEHDEQIDRDDD